MKRTRGTADVGVLGVGRVAVGVEGAAGARAAGAGAGGAVVFDERPALDWGGAFGVGVLGDAVGRESEEEGREEDGGGGGHG